jgi:hypothetical protein
MKVTPFQASIATGLLTVGATWLGSRINWTSQARREREAREAERRHVFEQKTLIDLQDALMALYQLVEETVLVERFPPEIDAHQVVKHDVAEPLAYRVAVADVDKLRQRVLDHDLAANIDALLQAAGRVMVATTREEAAHRQFDGLIPLAADVNEQIGERLRHLFIL